jgi:CMP-N,N'-diacetyllegionaminic acid synthase
VIGGRSVLGIIPARGGSKGVPGKNIRPIAGKPLLAWTILAAQASEYIDRLVLSSEDEAIIESARAWGCEVPFVRPAELATDDAPGTAPVLHALNMLPGYDYAVLLQPTSPLRTAEDIDACVALCAGTGAPAVVSVTRSSKHPAWMYELEDGRLRPVLEHGPASKRRQDLREVYALNGAVYVIAVSEFLANPTILGADTRAYPMPEERSVDIDTALDFSIAEFLLRLRP